MTHWAPTDQAVLDHFGFTVDKVAACARARVEQIKKQSEELGGPSHAPMLPTHFQF